MDSYKFLSTPIECLKDTFLKVCLNKYGNDLLRSASFQQLNFKEFIQKEYNSDTNAGTNMFFFGFFDIVCKNAGAKVELQIDSNNVFVNEYENTGCDWFGIAKRIEVTGSVHVNFTGYIVQIN